MFESSRSVLQIYITDQREKSVGKLIRWTDRRCFVQNSAWWCRFRCQRHDIQDRQAMFWQKSCLSVPFVRGNWHIRNPQQGINGISSLRSDIPYTSPVGPLQAERPELTLWFVCKYASQLLKASYASYTQRARSDCFVPAMQKMQNNRDFTLSLHYGSPGKPCVCDWTILRYLCNLNQRYLILWNRKSWCCH